MTAKALVLRAAGTNCDLETAHAFERAGADTERIHINRIADNPELLDRFGILVVPGGFTYGDDVAAGRILANEMTTRIAEPLHRFVERGSLVLGICNGFQVLLKTGLLPGWDVEEPQLTLTDNLNGSFQDRWVWLQPSSPHCVFTQGMTEPVYYPIAHAEGRFVARDEASLDRLEAQGQIAFKYTSDPNVSSDNSTHPSNPNGSDRDIAGICDPTGRVMGLMPHPERHMLTTQHPRWSKGDVDGDGEGMTVFQNAVKNAVAFDADTVGAAS
jgi:phosphoribosylformylglycinamidine synthase subunit PurQ / glutaminase